jgi:hypothetical protein
MDVKAYSAYDLARMVGVEAPDSLTSPGAVFLTDAADAFADRVAGEDPDRIDVADCANDAVDGLLVWNYMTWRVFVDLAAYSYDIDPGLIEGVDDMTERAEAICAEIGRSLCHILWQDRDSQR